MKMRTTLRTGVGMVLLVLLLGTAARAQVMAFDLTVAGVQVDTQNAKDVLEDGKVKYDDRTKTLTLKDATIKGSYTKQGIFSRIDGLTIALEGANRVEGNAAMGISFTKPTSISGSASATLTVISNMFVGISGREGANLTIAGGCTVVTSGKNGSIMLVDGGTLTVMKSTVKATGSTSTRMASITAKDLKLSGCAIAAPLNATFNGTSGTVVDAQGKMVTSQVVIEPGLYVQGILVTLQNAGNVLGDANKSVSYDTETRTLTLNKATINATGTTEGILSQVEGLKIALVGVSKITSANAAALKLTGSATIRGSVGTDLSVTSKNNIAVYYPYCDLVVEGGCRLFAKGATYGLCGDKGVNSNQTLRVRKSYISATGPNGSIAFTNGIRGENAMPTKPEGAGYNGIVRGIALNGVIVTSEVVISPTYDVSIGDITTTGGPLLEGGTITITPYPYTHLLPGTEVTVTTTAEAGYRLKEASIRVHKTGDPADRVSVINGKFNMPGHDVTVTCEFEAITYQLAIATGIVNGRLTTEVNGRLTTEPLERAAEFDMVHVIATADDGYRLKPGSLRAYNTKDEGQEVEVRDGFFVMPSYDVTVTGEFEPITYLVAIATGIENGRLTTEPLEQVAPGSKVSITATPEDGFRLKEGSLKVYKTDEPTVLAAITDHSFVMPEYDVTVTCAFEEETPANPTPVFSTELRWRVAVDGLTLTIFGAEGQRVEVYNVAGACISRVDGVSSSRFRVSVPQAGVYVVRVGKASKKVVVQ